MGGGGLNCRDKLFSIEILGQFSKDSRRLIEPADMVRIADNVDGGSLRCRDQYGAPGGVEALHRGRRDILADNEGNTNGPTDDRTPTFSPSIT